MKRVQVAYKVGGRSYTYEYEDDIVLFPGDVVEVPVGDDRTTQAIVIELGSSYSGPCKSIGQVLRKADPIWERVERLADICATQCSDGNWNYDPYMHGMANALLLAVHTIKGLEGMPPYLDPPTQWLYNIGDEQADEPS